VDEIIGESVGDRQVTRVVSDVEASLGIGEHGAVVTRSCRLRAVLRAATPTRSTAPGAVLATA
jgi:hypothetical protein